MPKETRDSMALRAAGVLTACLLAAGAGLAGCKSDTEGGADGQFGALPSQALRRSLLLEFKRAVETREPVKICVSVPDAASEADAAAVVAGRYVHSAIAHAVRQWFEAARGLMAIPTNASLTMALRASADACLQGKDFSVQALRAHDEIIVVTGKEGASFPAAAQRVGWAALLSPLGPSFAERDVAWAWPTFRTIVDRVSADMTKDPKRGTYVYLRRMFTHEVGHLMGLADTYIGTKRDSDGTVVATTDRGTHLPSAMQITACTDPQEREVLLLNAITDDDRDGLRAIADFLERRTARVECPVGRSRHASSNASEASFDFCVTKNEALPTHVRCPKVLDSEGRELGRVARGWKEAGVAVNDHSREAALRAFGPRLDEFLPYFECNIVGLKACLTAKGGVNCYARTCGGRAVPSRVAPLLPTATVVPMATAIATATPFPPSPLPTVTPVSTVTSSPAVIITPQSF